MVVVAAVVAAASLPEAQAQPGRTASPMAALVVQAVSAISERCKA